MQAAVEEAIFSQNIILEYNDIKSSLHLKLPNLSIPLDETAVINLLGIAS